MWQASRGICMSTQPGARLSRDLTDFLVAFLLKPHLRLQSPFPLVQDHSIAAPIAI